MKYPDKKRIASIMHKVKKRKMKSTLVIDKNASPVDQIKFNICQQIIKFRRDQELLNKEIAEIIGVGPAVVSRILHCEISKFKIDSLLSYFISLVASLNNAKREKELNRKLASFMADVA